MLKTPKVERLKLAYVRPRRWDYETDHKVADLLAPAYFDEVARSLRVEDVIGVIAFSETPAKHFKLVVDSIAKGPGDKVKVSMLAEYKRKAA